jgi:hypothetical protein
MAPNSQASSDIRAAQTHLNSMQAMASLITGTAGSHRLKGKRKKQAKLAALAVDGQPIGKFFNLEASRPYPNFTKLNQTITVVETYTVAAFLVTSTTVNVGAATAFTLSSFADYTNYTACFDQYRIDQLEVWLELNGNPSATLSTIVTVVDLDDATVPTTAVAIQDKQGALLGSGAAMRYHRWRPHVAVAEYSGSFTSYGNVPSTWIDCGSPNVQHYGFKACAVPQTGATYNLQVRAVISFCAPGL